MAGSHWLWEIISLLQQRSSTPSETENKYQTFLETSSHEILEGLKQPRLMSTHLMHKELPAEMMKCQVIVPIRHPKDVAVSLYHHLSSEKRGTNLRCGWDRFIDELWFSDQLSETHSSVSQLQVWDRGSVCTCVSIFCSVLLSLDWVHGRHVEVVPWPGKLSRCRVRTAAWGAVMIRSSRLITCWAACGTALHTCNGEQ